ncbi:extended synaptotagmin-3-like isoform X2 [Latimeria chalumnae]|uniref:extended synaptotagmin-3-like isoform X2 n=1 Tax=Latimeria chalumnae TaxID=7897 RepID=UPI00313B7159
MKSGAESKERSRRSLSPGGSSSSSSGGGSEPSDLEEGEQPGAVNQLVLEMLVYLGRALVYLFPVYLAGYLGLSLSWVLLGLFLWMSWRRKRKGKQGRLTNALELLEDEKVTIAKQISQQELPPWVTFPDIERVEWINKILLQAWPYFGMYMEKIFRDSIEPAIRGSNLHLKGFTFTKVNLGEKALRITGVKAYTKEVDRRQVILDFQLSYAGDCEVNVEVKKLCKAGVKGIQLHGTLRVILEPLIRDMPLVGAVTMFFIRRPVLEVNWTGLTNLLDVPGFCDLSDTMILDIIASYMVLPNRFTCPLVNQVNVAHLKFPLPHGVVRVYLIEAEDLTRKDTYLMGMVKGKSDPYGVLRVGTNVHRSKTIQAELNPVWKETYDFVVHEAPGQDLEVELFDEDPDKDDFLGSIVIDLGEVMKDRVVDEWYELEDIESGKLHLKMEWLSLLSEKERLSESNGFSTAMLLIYVDSAFDLPSAKKDTQPSSYVQFSVGETSQKSKICYTTDAPVWEEAFNFFIKDPNLEVLYVEIKDDERKCALGFLEIPLYRLLKVTDMTLDQRFQLSHSGPNSLLKMKIILRILSIEEPNPDSVYTGLSALKKGPLSTKRKKRGSRSEPSPTSSKTLEYPKTQQTDINRNKAEPQLDQKDNVNIPSAISEDALELPTPASSVRTNNTLNRQSVGRETPSVASESSLASSAMDLSERNLHLHNGQAMNEEPLGEIQVTVRYATIRQCLIVVINACRNLISSTSTEGSDPYVRVYLLPDKRWFGRKKTTVKKKTLNPQYDEKFEFVVALEEVKKRKLDIAVKHNKSFTSHERKELGKVLIDLSTEDLVKGFTQWYELTMQRRTRR